MAGAPGARPAANASSATNTAALAKAAFRRLALAQQEPTPENYAKAYAEESGQPLAAVPANTSATPDPALLKAQGQAWSALAERLVRNTERGGKQWTAARRKDSLQRVFSGSRSDPLRLLERLQSLMGAWESDQPSDPALSGIEDPPLDAPVRTGAGDAKAWWPVVQALQATVDAGLPGSAPQARQLAQALADELAGLADAVAAEGATAGRVSEIEAACGRARRVFGYRHQLVDTLTALCQELGSGLGELAEDDSWVQGQCLALQAHLAPAAVPGEPVAPGPSAPSSPIGLTVRSVQAARGVLAETRQQQQRVREARGTARDALKQLIHSMLLEVGALG